MTLLGGPVRCVQFYPADPLKIRIGVAKGGLNIRYLGLRTSRGGRALESPPNKHASARYVNSDRPFLDAGPTGRRPLRATLPAQEAALCRQNPLFYLQRR